MNPKLKYIAGYLTVTAALCLVFYLLLSLAALTFNAMVWPVYLRVLLIFGNAYIGSLAYNQLSPQWKSNNSPSPN